MLREIDTGTRLWTEEKSPEAVRTGCEGAGQAGTAGRVARLLFFTENEYIYFNQKIFVYLQESSLLLCSFV